MANDCLFCKIVRKEIPAEVVLDDKEFLVFKDIHPKAPVHVLVVPKKHVASLAAAGDEDEGLLGRLLTTVRRVTEQLDIAASGYETVINTGKDGGQEVEHLHVHVMGGQSK